MDDHRILVLVAAWCATVLGLALVTIGWALAPILELVR